MSETLSEKIKYYRKLKGYSQENLADKTSLSKMSIRRYESGERQPRLDALKKIAAALECQVSDIDESLYINRQIPYFANALEELRTERNLTHKELAKELHVKEDASISFEDALAEAEADELKRIQIAYKQLNRKGKVKAVERVEELAEIPRYTKPDEPHKN